MQIVIRIAAEQLKLEPTSDNAIDIADRDEKKSIAYWTQELKKEGIEASDENIFIAASCDVKGIAFLKGEATVNVRKNSPKTAEVDSINSINTTGEFYNGKWYLHSNRRRTTIQCTNRKRKCKCSISNSGSTSDSCSCSTGSSTSS